MKSRPQVLILLLLATIANFGNGQLDVELHVAFITSFEGEFDSSVTVPAVRLATKAVNSDSRILRGYKLVVELIENITVTRNLTNSEVKSMKILRPNEKETGSPSLIICVYDMLDTRFYTWITSLQ